MSDYLQNVSFDATLDFDCDLDNILSYSPASESQSSAKPVERFVNLSKDEQKEVLDARTPIATTKKVNWATKLFFGWHHQRLQLILNCKKEGMMVLKEAKDWTPGDWNMLLKEFFLEVRKENKEKYTASSLKDIFTMLQYYCQNNLNNNINFWTNSDLREARISLDASMKKSTREGKVSGLRACEPISKDMELKFWSSEMLGTDHPKKLIFTLMYYLGKHFALRGGTEMHRLQMDKFTLKNENNKETLLFIENTNTKARNGGIKCKPKPVRRLESEHTENHDRCLVCIWKLYCSKRPENCDLNNVFLAWYRSEENVKMGKWYQKAVLGRHSLDGIVKTLTDALPTSSKCQYSNQSLRKTTATALHRAGVERADIAKVTGHSSLAIERYVSLDSKDHSRFTKALHCDTKEDATSGTCAVDSQPSVLQVVGPSEKKMRIIANAETNVVEISFS